MKIHNFNISKYFRMPLLLVSVVLFASCNKDLPDAQPIVYPPINSVANSIGAEISANPDYSFYKAAATRVGILPLLMDTSKIYTVLLPDNNAFIASGIPSVAAINAMPIANVGGIVQFSLIPGEQITTDKISDAFPNVQLPTAITIGVLPGTTIPLQMTVFLSKRGSTVWANTIPVVKPDLKFRNGTIQVMAALVAPASQLLKDAMYSNPDLTYFKAAIARADSNQVGLARLDSLLGYGVTNMTILAPSNKAFQDFLTGAIYMGLLAQGVPSDIAYAQAMALASTPDVFQNPALFSSLSSATIKGILAYHFLATSTPVGYQPNIRVFSNNFATTPTFYKTLVNAGIAIHPGVMGQATFAPGSPFVAELKFTGAGTGFAFAGPAAIAVAKDKFAINGVYHVIDKVLLPQ